MRPGGVQFPVQGLGGANCFTLAAKVTRPILETGDGVIVVYAEYILRAGRHAFRATVTKTKKYISLMRPGRQYRGAAIRLAPK